RAIVLCSARAGERFLGDLRTAAYDKLQELSLPFFEETRAGVLMSRLTADVQTLTTFTRQVLVEVVGSVLLFIVSVVILVTLSPLLVVGGYLERHGRVSVGTVVAFALYLISLFDPVARLGDWYSEFQSGRAALAKISSLLAEPATVLGGIGSLPASGALSAEA